MDLRSQVIFENEDFIAVNKPAGLLSIPDRDGKEISLKKILQEKFGTIFTVHRLDKDTSGVILFAKNQSAHQHISLQFQDRQTEKIYLGLVTGSLVNKNGSIHVPIFENDGKDRSEISKKRGKESRTDYRVLEDFGLYSWLEFRIHTGRMHQVRVHAKYMGHPLACDAMYGVGKPVYVSSLKAGYKLSKNEETEKPILDRLALHAARLSFTGPDHKRYQLEAPLPRDLKATLQQLEKRSGKKQFS